MEQRPGGPALDATLSEWLNAREDTRRHLAAAARPVDDGWVQHLADLLATEQAWQAQYTDLIALHSSDGTFPPSNR